MTHSNCQPDRGMHNAKIAENVNDRELFSEPLEPPINPLLIHMVPPFMNVKGPMFCLQINGEVVWESRKVYSYPRICIYHGLCNLFFGVLHGMLFCCFISGRLYIFELFSFIFICVLRPSLRPQN